jgi:CRP-like cAMP-binding protein
MVPLVIQLDTAASRAWAASVFAELASTAGEAVLSGHRDVSVPAGHRFLGADHRPPHQTGLVVSGLLRMYLLSGDGRQANIRYAGPGYFLGATSTVSEGVRFPPSGVEAVTAARVLYLNQLHLRAAARADAGVAWALARQLVQYQGDLLRVLVGTAFGSIRERTAMHLLDLSVARPDGLLVAPVTQQALADAVGTTRETVARALGELRDEGMIVTARGGIVLLHPEQLAAEAEGSVPL